MQADDQIPIPEYLVETPKPLRPDARRAATDIAFKHIATAEQLAREEKTARLRATRVEIEAAKTR